VLHSDDDTTVGGMKRFEFGNAVVELVRGDITRAADVGDLAAVVNAANSSLRRGGGVDGAIHRASGPELARALDEIRASLPGGILPPGGAVITPAFDLPVTRVIHCVGPVYAHEGSRSADLLRSAYTEALRICREEALQSVAFPAISTGVYGYPIDKAAFVAGKAVADVLRTYGTPRLVRFVLFDDGALAAFVRAFEKTAL